MMYLKKTWFYVSIFHQRTSTGDVGVPCGCSIMCKSEYIKMDPLLIIHQVIKEVELAGEFVRHLLL